MRPVLRIPPSLGTTRSSTQRTEFDDGTYTAAANTLAVGLGEYCSYCEAPVRGAIQVEHMMAKATGSNTAANQWRNFLLACNQCNSQKNKAPDTAERLSNYIWPSIVARIPQNQPQWCLSSDCFTYELRPPTAQEISDQTVADKGAQGLDAARSYAFVKPAGHLDAEMSQRAQNMIDLVGLNRYLPATKPADRRFEERTAAAVLAGQLAAAYLANAQAQPPAAELAMLEREIASAALSVGFWSMWMNAFRLALAGPGPRAADDPVLVACEAKLRDLFVKPFPGTFYLTTAERQTPPAATYLPPIYLAAYAPPDREARTPYDFAIAP